MKIYLHIWHLVMLLFIHLIDTPLNRAKCPGKLIELMKSGRAIVANKVGQIAEYIEDQKSGILVDSADPSDFSSQCCRASKK